MRYSVPGGSLLTVLIAGLCLSVASADQSTEDREQSVCGWLLERTAFAFWSSAAGKPDPDRWKSVPGTEPVTHKTRDRRVLHGYRISAQAPSGVTGPTTGFLLFAQGNAMLADQLLGALKSFAQPGVDVFVYDYRGYGQSQGNRRLKAVVADYREIFAALSASEFGRHKYLYGISFGGLVLLNVIGEGTSFDKAVIDSTPSRVSHMGCPEKYDPARNVPNDGSKLLLITGVKDRVVKPSEQADLRAAAESRGAQLVLSEEFAHPFMDRDASTHNNRVNLVKAFLFSR
jgi:alpha/beta superfamily hydrolase